MARPRIPYLVALGLLFGGGIVFAFSSGPPATRTGAPAVGPVAAELNCTACHSGNPLNSGGLVEILNVPAVYKPDSTYVLTVQLSSSQTAAIPGRRWGFEVTAVNGSTGAGFGTLVRSVADSTATQIVAGSGAYATRRYVEHVFAGTRTGLASPVSWTFRWIAPSAAAATVPVQFFAAGNAANGSSTSGDFIYTGSATALPPARISTNAALAFGSVIIGATAEQTLDVSNSASPPAGSLDYSLTAPAGFGAPGGSFSAAAGGGPNGHTITMDTATLGSFGGDLVVSSNDAVSAERLVPLSGTVLDHAEPSLDPTIAVSSDSVDFGTLAAGEFRDTVAIVANLGFSGGQKAQLELVAAWVTGGDGRFTIPGGFSPQTVGVSPASIPLHFDDSGATPDSTYSATLTLQSTDEALPGAAARPDLVVTLTARVLGPVAVNRQDPPNATRLLFAAPNPAPGRSTLGFDLARRGTVSFALYDVRGRLVRSLALGELEPGRHRFAWDGSDDLGSKVSPGIYFYRLSTPGFSGSGRLALID